MSNKTKSQILSEDEVKKYRDMSPEQLMEALAELKQAYPRGTSKIRWTEDELDKLNQLYPAVNGAVVSQILGKTLAQVRAKAQELDITAKKQP